MSALQSLNSQFRHRFRSVSCRVDRVRADSTIRKNCCRCATNARTIVPTCVAINVPRVNRTTCFRLCRSVSPCEPLTPSATQLKFAIFLNFTEILPLVEFVPESDIPEQEVERLLMAPPKPDTMAIDPFVDTIVNEDVIDVLPLTLDRDALRALDPASVLIARWPPPLKTKYLRNLLPELQISICPECLQVFNASVACLSMFCPPRLLNHSPISGIPFGRFGAASVAEKSLSILSNELRRFAE